MHSQQVSAADDHSAVLRSFGTLLAQHSARSMLLLGALCWLDFSLVQSESPIKKIDDITLHNKTNIWKRSFQIVGD